MMLLINCNNEEVMYTFFDRLFNRVDIPIEIHINQNTHKNRGILRIVSNFFINHQLIS